MSEDLKDFAEKLFKGGFKASADRVKLEQAERITQSQTIKPFGIKFLDDALSGIWKNDLIVVGADSGVGKTELLIHLALTSARNGFRVHYFALEAEPNEIERRVKYKHLARAYWEDPQHPHIPMLKYRYWRENRYEFELGGYDEVAAERSALEMSNISTFYKDESGEDFSADTLIEKVGKIRGETDLIIVDHLNYFDPGEQKDDKREVFRIMKTIRSISLGMGVPCILASQVRKKDRKEKRAIPDMEDIFGSSDVYKIATKVIMFGPNLAFKSPDNRTFETFMRAQKSRIDSSVGRFVGVMSFDISRNIYSRDYRVARAHNFDETAEDLPQREWPEWASSSGGVLVRNSWGRPYKDED